MARLSLPREVPRAHPPRIPPSKTINHAFVPALQNLGARTGPISPGVVYPTPPFYSSYFNGIYGTQIVLDSTSYTNQIHQDNFYQRSWSMEMMYMHSATTNLNQVQAGAVQGIVNPRFANVSVTNANTYAECVIMACSSFSADDWSTYGAIQPQTYSENVQGLYFSIHPNGWIKHFRRYGDSYGVNVAKHFPNATFTPGLWNHIAISFVYDSVTPNNSRFKYYINGYKYIDEVGLITASVTAPWAKQGALLLCKTSSLQLVPDSLVSNKSKLYWIPGAPYVNQYTVNTVQANHKYKYIRFLNYDAWPDGGFEIPDSERAFEGTGTWMPGINDPQPYPGKSISAINEIIKIDFSNAMTVNDIVDSSPNNWTIRKGDNINLANVKYVSPKTIYKY